MVDVYLLQVFNGLSVGSILLLVALGLAFSFGLMGVINMAHGEFIMIGAYAPYVLQPACSARQPTGGSAFLLAAIPSPSSSTALMGVAWSGLLIRFLYGRPLDTLLATWGVGLMLQQLRAASSARRTSRWSARLAERRPRRSPRTCRCRTSACSSCCW